MNKSISWTYNKEFEENGFFVIKNLYDPTYLYSEVPDENLKGKLILYDKKTKNYYGLQEETQVKNSIARRNFPEYSDAHHDIKSVLEKFIKRKLYKTYYYDRFYFANQELIPHTDHKLCEISCSLHISSNIKKPWNFKLKSLSGEEKSISLSPGDALVYKGCEVLHWRNSLESRYNKFEKMIRKIFRKKDDTYYHQIFFHYVLQDGNNIQFI